MVGQLQGADGSADAPEGLADQSPDRHALTGAGVSLLAVVDRLVGLFGLLALLVLFVVLASASLVSLVSFSLSFSLFPSSSSILSSLSLPTFVSSFLIGTP